MLQKKQGFPKEGEIVLCTVSKIQYNSVFVRLDEYFHKQGMIHISEISPGRIRNLRDYVKEGKVIVCKVLSVKLDRGHIDLSLRRVSESQRRQKNESLKKEQKAEKIIELTAHDIGMKKEELYKLVSTKILNDYQTIYDSFEDVVENDAKLDYFDKKINDGLEKQVRQKIKPKRVIVEGILTLSTYEPNGIETVKKAIIDAQSVSETVTIFYEGGGHFRMSVTAIEFKEAEKTLKKAIEMVENAISDSGEFKFDRKESKKE